MDLSSIVTTLTGYATTVVGYVMSIAAAFVVLWGVWIGLKVLRKGLNKTAS